MTWLFDGVTSRNTANLRKFFSAVGPSDPNWTTGFLVRRRANRGQVTSASLFVATGGLDEARAVDPKPVNNPRRRRNLGKSTNSSNIGAFSSHTRRVAFQQIPRLASPFLFPFAKARVAEGSPSSEAPRGVRTRRTMLSKRLQEGCTRRSQRWNQHTLQSEMWPRRDSRHRRPNQTDTLPALRPQRAIHHRTERLLGPCFSLLAARGAKWRGVFHRVFAG